MIRTPIQHPPGIARVAAAVVALIAWSGLIVQFAAILGRVGDPLDAGWSMLAYFTVLANLAVAAAFTHVALGRPWRARLIGGVTLMILLVGVTYWLLLRGLLELSGGDAIADFLLHSITPILAPIFWILFVPKGRLHERDIMVFAAMPAAYLAYALVRGALEGHYAYPFINISRLGGARVALNSVLIGLGFLLAALAFVRLDGRLARG